MNSLREKSPGSTKTPQPLSVSEMAVSVVVPTFREAGNLPVLIERLDALRRNSGLTIELIIVDDNSRDGTEELIASLNQPWVRLIVRTNERGLSSAVLRGLENARHDVLIVMDADLSHPPETIPLLLERLEGGADFVIGSRYVQGASTDASWGVFRWLNSKVATWMARPLTSVRDPMSGFFALRRRTFQAAAPLNPIGYKIGLELLVKCGCRRVEEVPIHFADRTRGESKLSMKEQLRYVQHLGRLMDFRYAKMLRLTCLVAVMAAFLIPAVSFLPHQSYYVDETTQLSGLTLGPIEVTKWLAGDDARRFGVPPDRMPPISYWAGWLWSQVFGLSEVAMRWFGVLCMGMALILVWETARRAWGLGAALVAGLLFALSPNVIVNAAEIRAYPLFVLFSAAGFFCLVNLLQRPISEQKRWLTGIVICSLLATYTHFYGLLLCGSLLTAAFGVRLWSRQSVSSIIAAGIIILVGSVGLWPFVAASFQKSGGNAVPDPPTLGAFVKFIYRGLFGHPASATNTIVLGAGALAFVSLCVLSLLPKRRASMCSSGLVMALAAGVCVAAAVSLVFSAFDGMHASYNLWRLPAFALLVASTLSLRWPIGRVAAITASVVLVVVSAFGAMQLVIHPTYFTHGPHRQIAQMIDQLGTGQVSVIHEGDAPWGQTFYPIRYTHGVEVRQYHNSDQNPGARVARLPDDTQEIDPPSLDTRYVMVINGSEQGWTDLADQIGHGDRPIPPGPVARELGGSSRWRQIESKLFVALVAADVRVFERADNN